MLHEISQRGRFAILLMLCECLECLGPKMLDFYRTRFPQAQTLSSLHDAKSFMSPVAQRRCRIAMEQRNCVVTEEGRRPVLPKLLISMRHSGRVLPVNRCGFVLQA